MSHRRTAFLVFLVPFVLGFSCGPFSSGRTESGTQLATGAAEATDGAADAAPPPGAESIGPDRAKRLYYQYIDEKGRVRFTERIESVPAKWRDKVGFVELDSPPPTTPADAERARKDRYARSGRSQQSRDRIAELAAGVPDSRAPEVILYYAEWCGYCRKAKAHLERRGTPYELRDIDDPRYLDELLVRTGQKGVPVIDIDGRVLIGFDARRLDAMLDAA